MFDLSFQEQRFLVLYRKFYGSNYPALTEDNTNAHVKAQKMCYLLSLKNVDVGKSGFVWDKYGPYSENIQNLVRELDKKGDEVRAFYERYPDDDVSNELFFSDQPSKESLFRKCDGEKIEKMRQELGIQADDDKRDENDDTPVRRWTELLGTIVYISQSMLPGADKEQLDNKLVRIKKKYRDDYDLREKAFRILGETGLLTSI